MEGTLGRNHGSRSECVLDELREGKDQRAAMGLPLVLGSMLLGTLLGDMFKFRSEGLWSRETAAFDHITPWPKPSSSPESMGENSKGC